MNENDLAYTAGYIDGDGCFFIGEIKMKKVAIGLMIVLLAGCGLAKVDAEQNENMQVFVQAHNALVTQLNKVIGATDKAFSVKKTQEQEVFRAAMLATPTPTIAPAPETK